MSRYKQPFSLYKRGKYWYFRTYRADGIRTSGVSTGCTSKNAAMDFCNELYKTNKLYEDRRNFAEYAGHFFDDNSIWVKDRAEPLAVTTLRGYRNFLNNHLIPDIGKKYLSEINYSFIKNYRLQLLEKLKPSSVNQIMSTLKIILTVASRDELIRKNPFNDIERLAVAANRRDGFALDEVARIYNTIPELFKPAVVLQAVCGLRVSEARVIDETKIKIIEGHKFLEISEQLIDGVDVVTATKSKKARVVPLPDVVHNIVIKNHVFDYNLYKREIKKIAIKFENAAERNLSAHSLRHFFITAAKAAGVLPQKVEQIAGHSLKGIEGVYTSFKPLDLVELEPWQVETVKTLLKETNQ